MGIRDGRRLASWIDTEGHVLCRGDTAEIAITQKEREPLDTLCAMARDMGMDCSVVYLPKLGAHRMIISGADDVAATIRWTENDIINPKKKAAYEECRRWIFAPRKKLDIRIRRARAILLTKKIGAREIRKLKRARRPRLA
jgi:hypothetical protein